jgi:multidrug efflux pump subunit AcrB
VEKAVINRYFTVGCVLALFFLSLSLLSGGFLKFKAFPALEGDVLEMRLLMPQGTPLEVTESIVQRSIEKLNNVNEQLTTEQPNQHPLVTSITVEYNTNLDAKEQGTHVATVRADLLTSEKRNTSIAVLQMQWRKAVGEIPGALSLSFKEPSSGPAGKAIEIRLHGSDLYMLSEASYSIKQALYSYSGVHNVMDDFRLGKEEYKIQLLPGAMALGVDGATIANQLRGAFFGETADEFQVGNESIEIDVQLAKADKNTVWQLNSYPITLANGTQIPLSAVAILIPERGFSTINRVNGERTVSIIGDINAEQANTGEIIGHLKATIISDLLLKFPSLSISYEGEVKEGSKTGQSLAMKFLIGLFCVFIVLSIQFRSYFEPIMVMLAIPLALIGVLWGHVLLGYDFTIPSIIGFVSLAGIVVNDSILLVSYIKEHQKQGMGAHESAICAAKERFRAVFITSATTIAGMLPLLMESSLQAQLIQPLVVSLMFGIASSTFLILFVLPCLYTILDDWGVTSKHHLDMQA